MKDQEEETLELHRNKKRDKGKERKENRNRKNEPDRKVCPGWQPVFFQGWKNNDIEVCKKRVVGRNHCVLVVAAQRAAKMRVAAVRAATWQKKRLWVTAAALTRLLRQYERWIGNEMSDRCIG